MFDAVSGFLQSILDGINVVIEIIQAIVESAKSFFSIFGQSIAFFNNAASVLPGFLVPFFTLGFTLLIILKIADII